MAVVGWLLLAGLIAAAAVTAYRWNKALKELRRRVAALAAGRWGS